MNGSRENFRMVIVGPSIDSGEGFYAMRVMAGPKPYCLLNAMHRVSARLWNACLYQGYLMGCNSSAGLADEAKYLPLIIKCNEAGWQPVTHARATPLAVGIERWGGEQADAPLYFSVLNRSREPVSAEISIDRAALRRPELAHAIALVENATLETKASRAALVVKLELDPEQASVFEVRR